MNDDAQLAARNAVTGRTTADAAVDIVRLLGRAGPYAVFLAITLYAISQLVATNNSRLIEVEKARNESLEKNSAEIDRLNNIVRENADAMAKLRVAQFDEIQKANDLGRAVTTTVLSNQDLLSSERNKLFDAEEHLLQSQRQVSTAKEEQTRLQDEMQTLKAEKYRAENIIDAADLILAYLGDPGEPGADRTALSRRFDHGNPEGMMRAADGTTSYGEFRIPAQAISSFVDYVQNYDPEIAQRLNDNGGQKGATDGSTEFQAEWRSLARDPAFDTLQAKWIDDTLYRPLLASLTKLAKEGRAAPFDPDGRSVALQAVIWSVAVQEGPKTAMLRRAWTGHDLGAADDADLICAVFRERANISVYRPDASELRSKLLRARYRLELQEALRMLASERPNSVVKQECRK
jgi:hypothetical protein